MREKEREEYREKGSCGGSQTSGKRKKFGTSVQEQPKSVSGEQEAVARKVVWGQ